MSAHYKRILLLVSLPVAAFATSMSAQDNMEEFRRRMNEEYAEFAEASRTEYANFRQQVNREYEDFMRSHPWTPTQVKEPLPPPPEKEPEPQVEPEDQQDKPAEESKPIVIEEVIETPAPLPQPQPVEPIEEMPVTISVIAPLPDKDRLGHDLRPGPQPEPTPDLAIEPEPEPETGIEPTKEPEPDKSLEADNTPTKEPEPEMMTVSFYGTDVKLRPADFSRFKINGRDQDAFADGWAMLANDNTNNLIIDCLKARDDHQLPDWGYIRFLDQLAGQLTSPGSNEQTMLLGFLLNQSGYKVRYSYDKHGKLHMLYGSTGIVYNTSRSYVDGDWYYAWTQPEGSEVYMCNFGMPKEQSVSMSIDREPLLAYNPGTTREIVPRRFDQYKFTVTPNRNLCDFYADYPECTVDYNPLTMWLVHGNTPVSSQFREQLYPELRKAVEGKTQLEAVQFLLKVAQSFPYEFDEEIWGRDRAFWMEESWEYPFSDCEDHSINFTHMVRDILGLDACLIYYPGHLSSCVAITDEDVKGDYIDYQGKRYYVCDPTYFYAGVGKTAPSNNNAEAVLLPLR